MKNNILVWCFSIVAIFYTSTTLAAPKGICTPDNGVFHSVLDFP
ncbi:hypothetical protein EC12741_3225 [Escherichia coli 1.2741]|nr:hypothetical protein EC12741_3225 [Escherichia coli 1.2741]